MSKNYVILPKIKDQNLLAKYYSMADAFVICSKRENFPTTCIEAQCCGTPVVGFNTGGTKETTILDRRDFVTYGDVGALKTKLNNVLDLDLDRLALAQMAQERYSKETMAKNYLAEYDTEGKKNRILLIDVNCKYSSTGKIVYDLYSKIREDGREAAICYGRGPLVEGENIYKFGIDWETYLHAALARISGYNGYFSYFSTRRLIDYIEKFKPDLVHIHELHAYFVNIKTLVNYLKTKKIKIVWTFHCEYMYTGKCGYAYDCNKFETQCEHCPVLGEYPKSVWFDKTDEMFRDKREYLDGMDFTIVTPSEWLAERVKRSFLKNKIVKVIHNGIDTSVFKPVFDRRIRNELQIPIDNKIVLAVAPDIMSERKGGKWVLGLAEKSIDQSITYILIGAKKF